jgi:hypothetical protein
LDPEKVIKDGAKMSKVFGFDLILRPEMSKKNYILHI